MAFIPLQIKGAALRFPLKVLVCVVLFSSLGCREKNVPQVLTHQNLPQLIEKQEGKKKLSSKNKYLDSSEKALLYFYQRDFEKASPCFEKSFRISEELYSASLKELALSKILNERAKTFRPHYLERWSLIFLASVNHLAQNKKQEALVELRRLSRDIRLENDIYGEEKLPQAKQDYLCLSGWLFFRLGEKELAYADLLMAQRMDEVGFPEKLATHFDEWTSYRKGELNEIPPDSIFSYANQSRQIFLKLSGRAPQKVESRLQVTMINFWPVVQGMIHEDADELNKESAHDLLLGLMGHRALKLSYPVFKGFLCRSELSEASEVLVDFSQLLLRSWALQKKRLVAQSLLRIIFKLSASAALGKIDDHVKGDWGVLLSHLGRLMIWETERADLRQIHYLPSRIELGLKKVIEGSEAQVIEIDLDDFL